MNEIRKIMFCEATQELSHSNPKHTHHGDGWEEIGIADDFDFNFLREYINIHQRIYTTYGMRMMIENCRKIFEYLIKQGVQFPTTPIPPPQTE